MCCPRKAGGHSGRRSGRESAASAHQLIGLSPLQERQLARSFADHRRALRLEMAHLAVGIRDSGQAGGRGDLALLTGDIADFPVAPRFLESETTRAVLLKIDADGLPDREDRDADSTARCIRVLTTIDGDLSSLENSMRAGSTQASR